MTSGLTVSVLVARCSKVWKNTSRWQVDPVRRESRRITLLARVDEANSSFIDFHILLRIDRPGRFRVSLQDSWLKAGIPLDRLSEFLNAVKRVQATRRPVSQR